MIKVDLTPLLSGEVTKLGFSLAEFPDGESPDADLTLALPIRVSGSITNQAGYMSITLTADYTYDTVCARCLAITRKECSLDETKGIKRRQSAQDEEDDDYLLYTDRTLVLDDVLWDLLLVNLPYRHLCREDCAGICPECGKNRNEGACGCVTKKVDPRLAILGTLLDGKDE